MNRFYLLFLCLALSSCFYVASALYPAADPVFGVYPMADGIEGSGNPRPWRGGGRTVYLVTTQGVSRQDVSSARPILSNGRTSVEIVFRPESLKKWADLLRSTRGESSYAVVVNGEVVAYQNLNEPESPDRLFIYNLIPDSGPMKPAQAQSIAKAIMASSPASKK